MAIPTVEATQVFDVTSASTTTGAITLSLGTISENDIILALVALDGTDGNPTGSGNNSGAMTAVQSTDEGTVECEALWVRQGSTVDTTITINWTGSEECRVILARIAGAITTGSIIDVVGTGLTGSGTTATPVSSASTVVDTLFISFVSVDGAKVDDADTVTGTGWTELGTSNNTGGGPGIGSIAAELDQASIGTPANAVFGTWSADNYAAYTFNIKPPAAGGGGFAHSQAVIIS